MLRRRIIPRTAAELHFLLAIPASLFALLLVFDGCNRALHTSDPHLQKIDEMLNKQLPPGTPRARVTYFLSLRGYPMEDATDKNSMVATVRQVDTDTLQPATARVTFHFDPNNKLTSYELAAVPDAPLPP
jgi:hypothetical protein